MITITCTNCQTLLEIDDAFAGGVCRCRHCGTIQTVPALSRRPVRPGTPGEAPALAAPPVPAYVAEPVHKEAPMAAAPVYAPAKPSSAPATPSGTGLDEIAAAVASSGLVGTGLTGGRLRKGPPGMPSGPASVDAARGLSAKQKQMLAMFGGGAGVLLVMGILLGYALSGGSGDGNANTQNPNPGPVGPKPQTPTNGGPKPAVGKRTVFLDIPLKGPSVVYVIDRGPATKEVFEQAVYDALVHSLRSLPPEWRFQLIFTEIRKDMPAWPPSGLTEASPGNVDQAISASTNVSFGFAQSHFERPVREALKHNPADIVLVSGKSDLGDELLKQVMELHRSASSTSRIHTVGVGESRDALSAIAARTKGEFRTLAQLREFVEKHR